MSTARNAKPVVVACFFFNGTATTEIYTLSLHDALPILFPQNTDFPGQRVPYFIDRYGTRCAMAYLIEQSGEGDLVTRVAATHNNARIPELRTDPDLGAWLWRNGITLEEAARIQPAYGCCPVGAFCIDLIPQPCPSTTSTSVSVGYKVA